MSGKITIRQRLKLLKQSAKKRNISVNLNEGFYKKLLDVGCMFCGKSLHDQGGYCLDRDDNTKGYTQENVSPCCKHCNQAKGMRTKEEYFNWIRESFVFQETIREVIKGKVWTEKDNKRFNNKIRNSKVYRNSETIEMEGSR